MLWLSVALTLTASGTEPVQAWWHGDHLTGDWGGARTFLADHGLTIDFVYALEVFNNAAALEGTASTSLVGHFDLGVTLDFERLDLWKGGRFDVLAQNGHGTGSNEYVGSVTSISNIEAPPYTQLTEFFFEQSLFDDRVRLRLGKQDANREFGTPRFGGNFLNNNFGMVLSAPTQRLASAQRSSFSRRGGWRSRPCCSRAAHSRTRSASTARLRPGAGFFIAGGARGRWLRWLRWPRGCLSLAPSPRTSASSCRTTSAFWRTPRT